MARSAFRSQIIEHVHAFAASSTYRIQNSKGTKVETLTKSTRFWRAAHFEVKIVQALQHRTTFGSARRCGAKSISKSKWYKHFSIGPLLEVEMSKKCTRLCGAKSISKSKVYKHFSVRPLLEVEMPKKCAPLWRQVYFKVKSVQALQRRTTFGS